MVTRGTCQKRDSARSRCYTLNSLSWSKTWWQWIPASSSEKVTEGCNLSFPVGCSTRESFINKEAATTAPVDEAGDAAASTASISATTETTKLSIATAATISAQQELPYQQQHLDQLLEVDEISPSWSSLKIRWVQDKEDDNAGSSLGRAMPSLNPHRLPQQERMKNTPVKVRHGAFSLLLKGYRSL